MALKVRADNMVLLMKSLGIDDIMNFGFMDPPPYETVLLALSNLNTMRAINDIGTVTFIGRQMAKSHLALLIEE